MKFHQHPQKQLHHRHASGGAGRRQQQGAVLVVGLIILVVLTMLGVQGMRTNVAQERMAGNMLERNVAFQAAEAALRVGEATRPFVPAAVPVADLANWDGAGATDTIPSFDDGLVAEPAYHIGPPEYVRIGLTLPPEFRLIYPVASRGTGRQEGSVVVLQSGFEPPN